MHGSLEMKPAETMAKMCRQASGSGNPAIGYIRDFIAGPTNACGSTTTSAGLQRSAWGVATYVRKELKADHIVIDSLMKCGLGTDDYTAQRDFVDGLCAIARDTGLHIHRSATCARARTNAWRRASST